ncbi:MAG: LysM peptidoglycan-binding domain-containing protein [Aquificota bacterium]|nr:MAG: LysM peptidoglycan-binding domain-containing protein [Aquificota bacterium]
MKRGTFLGMALVLLLSSCTPAVRQATVLKRTDHIEVVKKGSFMFSEEEERFLEREAQVFGIQVPDREEIRRFAEFYINNKRTLEVALERANLYIPVILPIIEKHGLPRELALLPVIESAFNNFAVSKAGAAGLWQFIPSTARRYGLRVDEVVDERFDVVKATDAAMRYLKDLYNMFGSWELALAAYNCGENCVAKRTGGVDFWQTKAFLPDETRNYVPAFFAVLLITQNPAKYGLNINADSLNLSPKVSSRDTTVEDVIKQTSIKESTFRDLNPHIRGNHIPAGTTIYIPAKNTFSLREAYTKEYKYELPNGAKLIIRD